MFAERASELSITALGSQGAGKDISKQIEDWDRES